MRDIKAVRVHRHSARSVSCSHTTSVVRFLEISDLHVEDGTVNFVVGPFCLLAQKGVPQHGYSFFTRVRLLHIPPVLSVLRSRLSPLLWNLKMLISDSAIGHLH